MRIVAVLVWGALAGLAAGCVPSRDRIELPESVPVDRALSAEIRYVFFLPGKTGMAPDGAAAVAAAVVEDARRRAKGPVPRLIVTGHADAGGDPAAAQRLSLRRARLVAARLRAAGIAPGRITVAGAGAADPRRPAPPGQAEPANDRVEIGFESPVASQLDATPQRPI
ncbi:OmpA family protein [Inquilinus sp. CA228]|uniref:OmpA family protein n=1 Tax=Inquilinus sp. CA228 TaxID=3455609 RepID=UPI003F8D792E